MAIHVRVCSSWPDLQLQLYTQIFQYRLIQFGLTNGGTAGLIYGFIIVVAGFMCVYLSIAEMASM